MTNKIGTILFVFKFSFIQVTQQSNINKAKKRVHKTSQNYKKKMNKNAMQIIKIKIIVTIMNEDFAWTVCEGMCVVE